MKKRLLSALLGGVLLLSLGVAPSVGAPRSSQSLRTPKLPCRWVLVKPGHWELDCNIKVGDIGERIDAEFVDNLESDATHALKRIIRKYANKTK
jgi:hypothetical protein